MNQYFVTFALTSNSERLVNVLQIEMVRSKWFYVHIPTGYYFQRGRKTAIENLK